MSTRVRTVSNGVSRSVESSRERRIEEDLERLGVAGPVRGELARRLETLSRRLSAEEYDAALAGVAVAHGLHRSQDDMWRHSLRDFEEVQRLVGAFAEELHKLDEALRILSTYVRRMGTRARPAASKALH